ncbi:GNAT family N-acetyltransferase [Nocardioides sp. P5_E3]
MGLPLTVDAWPGGSVRTERLLLRAPEARDRGEFLALGSDPVVNHHLGGGQDRVTLEATLPAVPADRPAQYVMERDGRFLGWIGLSRREADRPGGSSVEGHGPAGVLELSYVLPVHAWGHGYAAEACAALLARSDDRLGEPVVLCTQVGNTRSRALAERLGFTEVERFEELGAAQWFGVRLPGWALPQSRGDRATSG